MFDVILDVLKAAVEFAAAVVEKVRVWRADD